MSSKRHLALAALLLGVIAAWLLHGRLSSPPVYDGIVVPPEPYRWESPPPNLRQGNQKPLGGQATFPVQNGQLPGGGVQTDDNQVIIFFGPGTFKVSGASSVKCTIDPVADPPPAPSGSDIRGNVYRIGCSGLPSGAVTVATTYHLTLRLPGGTVNDIQFLSGQSWQKLTTLFAPGGDPYASVNAPGFGDYAAMARSGSSSPTSIVSDPGRYLELFGILAFVVLFGVIALIQELRRRRRQRPAKAKRR
jgi:hypothetical protein